MTLLLDDSFINIIAWLGLRVRDGSYLAIAYRGRCATLQLFSVGNSCILYLRYFFFAISAAAPSYRRSQQIKLHFHIASRTRTPKSDSRRPLRSIQWLCCQLINFLRQSCRVIRHSHNLLLERDLFLQNASQFVSFLGFFRWI